MNYGLYIATSGAIANLHRMDVAANNLANVETPGFKPDYPGSRQRDAARIEDHLPFLPSSALLERLGAGARLMPDRVSTRQGALDPTGRNADVGINGPGFFVVRQGNDPGADSLRLSRDGRLTIDASGRLVQGATGLPVLDQNDRPISLRAGEPFTIAPSGEVLQNGGSAGTIQLTSLPDTSRLRHAGNGMLSAPAAQWNRRRPATGSLQPGTVERSAVDPISAMVDLTNAERSVTDNTRMIQYEDQLMDRAINSLGRVT